MYRYRVQVATRGAKRFGYIDASGEIVIPPIYDSARDFLNGFAAVGNWRQGRRGAINESGDVCIPISDLDYFGVFSPDGLVVVGASIGRIGMLDSRGRVVIPFEYNDLGLSTLNRIPYQLTSFGQFGYLDYQGNVVVPAQFESACSFAPGGLALVSQDTKFGYLDLQANLAIPLQFDFGMQFENGIAWASLPGERGRGVIDVSGAWKFRTSYEGTHRFSEGLAGFAAGDPYDSKYGFLNLEGKTVLAPQFDRVRHFTCGVAPVKKDGAWRFIHKDGTYLETEPFAACEAFHNDLARVQSHDGKRSGYINIRGEWVWSTRLDLFLIE